jgi:hypothetical protein
MHSMDFVPWLQSAKKGPIAETQLIAGGCAPLFDPRMASVGWKIFLPAFMLLAFNRLEQLIGS